MKDPDKKEKFSLKNRFRYWFDNRMSRGSMGFIRILIIASVLLAVLLAGLIVLLGFNEEGETASVFWDAIATVINAWMPSYEDGSPGYLVLMSLIAIAGVLFTSVLIGIITSAIEEKIDSLKRGNSPVLEKGHLVVLGFYPGEYTLLDQLILAAAGEPVCIVVAEDMEREEMEQNLSENLDFPINCRIICRTVDITDPASLEKCSLDTCRTVIISPTEEMRTIKTILAVSALLERKNVRDVRVNAILSRNSYRFPRSLAEANNITTLQTNEILAKMIAHSCTQTGLAETFQEVFNFEGTEFYLVPLAGTGGLTFRELTERVRGAVPVGIRRGGKTLLNPGAEFALEETDHVLIFGEDPAKARITDASANRPVRTEAVVRETTDEKDTVIIGHNETLPVILRELPENVTHVYLAGQETTDAEQEALTAAAAERNILLRYYPGDPSSERVLWELAKMAEHILILNDHDKEAEEADMEAVFLLLNLRDIRKRCGLAFNITVELQKEHNQTLVGSGDRTDFLVASSMSSLILAQLAESPELIDVFREILSNEGNELFLKKVSELKLEGEYGLPELRQILLAAGYILLGILDEDKRSRFDLPWDKPLTLRGDMSLIVLGEK